MKVIYDLVKHFLVFGMANVGMIKVLSCDIDVDEFNKVCDGKLYFVDWKRDDNESYKDFVFREIDDDYACIVINSRYGVYTHNIKELCDKYYDKSGRRPPIVYAMDYIDLKDEILWNAELLEHYKDHPFVVVRRMASFQDFYEVICSCVCNYDFIRVNAYCKYKLQLEQKNEILALKRMVDKLNSELCMVEEDLEKVKGELVIEQQDCGKVKLELKQSMSKLRDCTGRLYVEMIKSDNMKKKLEEDLGVLL